MASAVRSASGGGGGARSGDCNEIAEEIQRGSASPKLETVVHVPCTLCLPLFQGVSVARLASILDTVGRLRAWSAAMSGSVSEQPPPWTACQYLRCEAKDTHEAVSL